MGLSNFVNHQHGTPLHSSGYARVASRGMGAASPQSFGERIGIERNRQAIGRYGHSMIGRGHMKEVAPGRTDTPPRQSAPGTTRQRPNGHVTAPPRIQFKEPPTRPYNPYQ